MTTLGLPEPNSITTGVIHGVKDLYRIAAFPHKGDITLDLRKGVKYVNPIFCP
jgi:hypothetical protein